MARNWTFAKPGQSQLSATAECLADLKAGIESWYLLHDITYRLDMFGEGWAFYRGEPLGYICQVAPRP